MPASGILQDPRVYRRAFLALVGGSLAFTLLPKTDVRRYSGNARTAIGYVDPDTGGKERRVVETDVMVTVGPFPTNRPTGMSRRNPFEVVVERDPSDPSIEEGPSVIQSAVVDFETDDVGTAEFEGSDRQYWDINRESEGTFSGVLRHSNGTDSPSANRLYSLRELIPGRPDTRVMTTEPMADGSELRAEITEDTMSLRLTGNTTNPFADGLFERTRPFTIEIDASTTT